MLYWILAVLALYLCQVYVTIFLYLPVAGLRALSGGRDVLPDKGIYTRRADKALVNMKENLPFFLVPALLFYGLPARDSGMAVLGAQLFFWGRLVYVPLYMTGIPGLRSVAYGVGLAGTGLMIWALFAGA